MTTSITIADIIAALPADAWVETYYGGVKVGHEWEYAAADRSTIATRDRDEYSRALSLLLGAARAAAVAPIIEVVPALDDAAAWSVLAERTVSDLPSPSSAAAAEAALRPALRVMGAQIAAPTSEGSRIADGLVSWLASCALGQVGPQVIEPARTFHHQTSPWYAVRAA